MTDPHDRSAADTPSPQPGPVEPAAFQLRGDPPRVMRLSRKALAVVGIAAGLGIGASLIYALLPPGERVAQELFSTESRTTSEAITSGPKDYAQLASALVV